MATNKNINPELAYAGVNRWMEKQPNALDEVYNLNQGLLGSSMSPNAAWNMMVGGAGGMAQALNRIPTSYGMTNDQLANLSAFSNALGSNAPVLGSSQNLDVFGGLANAVQLQQKQQEMQAKSMGALGELGSNELSNVQNIAGSPFAQTTMAPYTQMINSQMPKQSISNFMAANEAATQAALQRFYSLSPEDQKLVLSDPNVIREANAAVQAGAVGGNLGPNAGVLQKLADSKFLGTGALPLDQTIQANGNIIQTAYQNVANYPVALRSQMVAMDNFTNTLKALGTDSNGKVTYTNENGVPKIQGSLTNSMVSRIIGGKEFANAFGVSPISPDELQKMNEKMKDMNKGETITTSNGVTLQSLGKGAGFSLNLAGAANEARKANVALSRDYLTSNYIYGLGDQAAPMLNEFVGLKKGETLNKQIPLKNPSLAINTLDKNVMGATVDFMGKNTSVETVLNNKAFNNLPAEKRMQVLQEISTQLRNQDLLK